MVLKETTDATAKILKPAEVSDVSLASIAQKDDLTFFSKQEEITTAVDYLPIASVEETDAVALANLQDLLTDFVPHLNDPEASTFAGQNEILSKLREERERGEYGETTQKLFAQLLGSIEETAAPQVVRELLSRQLTVAAGAPSFVARNIPYADGQYVEVPIDIDAVENPTLKADLKIDLSQSPNAEELTRVVDTLNWLSKQQATLKHADLEILDNLLIEQIKSDNLGEAWMPHEDENREQWRTAVTDLLDNIFKARKFAAEVRIINEVQRAAVTTTDRAGNYEPLPFPPGFEGLNQDGTVRFAKGFPPVDPRVESSGQFLRDLEVWSQQFGKQADLFASTIAVARANPQTLLAWTDLPLQDSEGVFVNGKFVNFVDEGMYEPRSDETLAEVNMLRQRFDVNTRTNEHGQTEIVVTQTVQATDVPFYGYQNVGAEDIGAPYENELVYKPEDFVPIQTPRGLSLIQAKDLETFQRNAILGHYGSIGIMVAGDLGMLMTLGPEVKALQLALKMGRPTLSAAYNAAGKIAIETIENELAGEGREAAASLTARQLYAQGAKTTLRAAATATAVFNNAGAMDTQWGETLNQLRGFYFLADMSFSMAGKSVLTPGKEFSEIIHQGNTPWLGPIHLTGDKLLKASEPVMVVMAFEHLKERAIELLSSRDTDQLDLLNPTGQPKDVAFAPGGNLDLRSVGPEVLAFYEKVLARNAEGNPEIGAIRHIFARTNEFLANPADAAGRTDFVSSLLSMERFSDEQILRLNKVMYENTTLGWEYPVLGAKELDLLWKGAMPTPGQLAEAYPDGNVPAFWNMLMSTDAVLAEAQKMRAEKEASMNLQVRVASRIAALVLSTDENGNLPAALNTEVKTPEAFYVTGNHEITALTPEEIQFSNYNLPVTTDELLRKLRADMDQLRSGEVSDANDSAPVTQEINSPVLAATSSEGIAIGDVLRRTGESDVYYAQMLQNILESNQTFKQDQLDALLGTTDSGYGDLLAMMIADNHESATFGSTVKDLVATLRRVASDEKKDADIRATAGLLAYLSNQDIGTFQKVWSQVKDLWHENPDMPAGAFSTIVSSNLGKIATSARSTDEQLQDAARVLMMLGGKANEATAARALRSASERARSLESYDTTLNLMFDPGQDSEIASYESIPDPLDALDEQTPSATQEVVAQEMEKICKLLAMSTSADESVKKDIPNLIETAMLMIAEGTPEDAQKLSNALREMISIAAHTNSVSDVENCVAALKAVSQLDGPDSMQFLQTYAQASINDASVNPKIGIMSLSLLDGLSQFDSSRKEQFRDLLSKIDQSVIGDYVLHCTVRDLKLKYGLMTQDVDTSKCDFSVPADLDDWLKDNVPALQATYERNALDKAADLGFFFTLFNSDEEELAEIRATMQETASIRATQFEMLAASAIPQADADIPYSKMAKKALFTILMQPFDVITDYSARPDGAEPGKLAIEWQVKAAQALVAASEPGLRNQSEAKELIAQALMNGKLPPAIEQILLDGWRQNAKPIEVRFQSDEIGLNSSYTNYVGVLNRVLANAYLEIGFQLPDSDLTNLIASAREARQEVTATN